MIKFINVKRLGVAVTALLAMSVGFSVASCNREKPNVPQEPEKPGVTVSPEQSGVRVMLEAHDLRSGKTYHFTKRGEGGDIEATGIKFYPASPNEQEHLITVPLEFYGRTGVKFKGWSWRYDHQGKQDLIQALSIQPQEGTQPLGVNPKFKVDHTVSDKVWIRVEYEIETGLKGFPEPVELLPLLQRLEGSYYKINNNTKRINFYHYWDLEERYRMRPESGGYQKVNPSLIYQIALNNIEKIYLDAQERYVEGKVLGSMALALEVQDPFSKKVYSFKNPAEAAKVDYYGVRVEPLIASIRDYSNHLKKLGKEPSTSDGSFGGGFIGGVSDGPAIPSQYREAIRDNAHRIDDILDDLKPLLEEWEALPPQWKIPRAQ